MRQYLVILHSDILEVIEAESHAMATEMLSTRYAFPEAVLLIEPRLYRSSIHNAQSEILGKNCAIKHGFWDEPTMQDGSYEQP